LAGAAGTGYHLAPPGSADLSRRQELTIAVPADSPVYRALELVGLIGPPATREKVADELGGGLRTL
jgi:hypothetical protein